MEIKSKTQTVTIDGPTYHEALHNASVWADEYKPMKVISTNVYPVDNYWVVQITFK